MGIVWNQVEIRGDDRAKIFTESDVHRRTVIQRPDHHAEKVVGGLGCFYCHSVDQVGVQAPRGQHARASSGDAQQVGDAGFVD